MYRDVAKWRHVEHAPEGRKGVEKVGIETWRARKSQGGKLIYGAYLASGGSLLEDAELPFDNGVMGLQCSVSLDLENASRSTCFEHHKPWPTGRYSRNTR